MVQVDFSNAFNYYDRNPKNNILDEKEAEQARRDGFFWAKKGMSALVFNYAMAKETRFCDQKFLFEAANYDKNMNDIDNTIKHYEKLMTETSDVENKKNYGNMIVALYRKKEALASDMVEKQKNYLRFYF